MPFSVNDPFLYWVAAAVIAVVVAQSVFFLVKSIQRAKKVGISMATVRKTILSSSLFTLAPAVSILIGITEPFFLFFNRNKDGGMPPRRQESAYVPRESVYAPVEESVYAPVQEEPWQQSQQSSQEPWEQENKDYL